MYGSACCQRGSGVREVHVCGYDDVGMNGQAATAGDRLAKVTRRVEHARGMPTMWSPRVLALQRHIGLPYIVHCVDLTPRSPFMALVQSNQLCTEFDYPKAIMFSKFGKLLR